jgi:UDP-N-acetylmuramoyl-L-alanyl-D-glutamate--2,6-diaminopimelate ligase
MMLRELFQGVNWEEWSGPADAEVRGLAYRSDALEPGDAFCTWTGAVADGHAHVPQALARGAAALVVERPVPAGPEIPVVRVTSGRKALAGLAANFHHHPSRDLALVGITGTNGKTSTAFLLHHLLEKHNLPSGLIGTVHHQSGSRVLPSSRTTPESLDLQALLARMRDDGCKAAVMEVSSHALHQDRVAGLTFQAAVFTQLTQDHLDYHRTMEAYFEAKALLFQNLQPGSHAVLNLADPWGRRLVGLLPSGVHLHGYAVEGDAASRAIDLLLTAEGLEFTWQRSEGAYRVSAPWIGAFNVANILSAAETACALGAPAEEVVRWIAEAPAVPGRMEKVAWDGPFTVLVDYAHTEDALRNVLSTLRPLVRGRLRVLVGCGGDRDRTKRPLMARAAAEWSDDCVLTADNPRSEDPLEILQQMKAGIPEAGHATIIPDRGEAIAAIIARARPGDVVVLAGKGHETTQEIAGVKTPFSDKEHAAKVLQRGQGARA